MRDSREAGGRHNRYKGSIHVRLQLLQGDTNIDLISLHIHSIGGSKGGARDTRPPLGVQILSFSCSFRQKIEK